MKIHPTILISLGVMAGIALAILIDGDTARLLIFGGLVIAFILAVPALIGLVRNIGTRTRKNAKPKTASRQARGTVKWFNYKKGFGFMSRKMVKTFLYTTSLSSAMAAGHCVRVRKFPWMSCKVQRAPRLKM